MTNEEILKKAIARVRKNGYKEYGDYCVVDWSDEDMREMIFNHSFAKAFWKDEPRMMCIIKSEPSQHGCATIDGCSAWSYHLQIMVLAQEPLKYLEKFI